MSIDELRAALSGLNTIMDSVVDGVHLSSEEAQQLIYEIILEQLNQFEVKDGRFVTTQNYAARLAVITRKINEVLGDVYEPSIKEYLAAFFTIDQTNTLLHRSYNQLEIEKELYTPIRKAIYNQAEYYLTSGLQDAYIQPAKFLLMQAVSSGMSIKDAERLMRNWNEGTYSDGAKLASDRPTPRLQTYATQLARDSMFTYQGTIQEVIKDRYGLQKFIYTGGLVKDSRPFCKHLVSLRRKITLDEIPDLVKKYPDGLKPNTTKKNFLEVRGGYSCRHNAMVVR